ncbi:MAG TPA: putative glycoside hydrolase [Armatimonadota bacterium]|nr:putative glycoside hydrolase [Armatimonadota bacterium]
MDRICVAWVLMLSVCWLAGAQADRSESERARDAIAAAAGLGESAPDWLVDSESYAIGYDPAGWEALAASKVAFITHCPINQAFFDRAHGLGIRCFPYITLYQGFATQTYEGINLKDHLEYIEIDADGNLKRSGFWESEDAKNMYTTCPNVQGYQDAMVAWVRRIMELGADGVFVDNLGARAECFGPQFGKHEHVVEGQDHAFALLLKRVREVVKEFKPDGAVLGNSAAPLGLPREYWQYLDAEMMESYICTWVSKDRWFDWHTHWHQQGVDLQPFVKAGKQIQCLSYLGHTPYGVREDAFFCYASARLGGFVWNGGTPLSDPDTAILYQIRLGKPLTDEREENGVFYRVFERGLVALNPDKQAPHTITIADPVPTTKFADLAAGQLRAWNSGAGSHDTVDYAVKHGGTRSVRMTNTGPDESLVSQTVSLDQTEPTPITASGWSKAEDAQGAEDGNYAIYLDILYTDGTSLFGQVASFSVGTHDWEFRSVTVQPEKPIRSLTYNILFRYRTGTVWFDELSLKEGADPDRAAERLQNGGLEDTVRASKLIDVAATANTLEVPAYSGRVYLYASGSEDQLQTVGPRLTVTTSPALGEVRFRVDGFDYWTCSGRWTTEYVLGPDFGRFSILFDGPGTHTVEVVDVVPSPLRTPAGYGAGERLGPFMDPSQPTRPAEGRSFRFRGWTGALTTAEARVEVDVSSDLTLTAEFDTEEAPGQ